ncbi:GNAT family N-acetyltransferase [Vibrio hangzhouensis]|uniref:GNAT family N-acetyltransferase n=1 Tax=Vibrio hangzhouensis TaxID=462991 RepID=UPI001C961184|nr:GNAT family N-acetyltransferase [Vibrio hangzhouensis]MBY6196055.1 GNAT family N-acetyltransferase [Vibrio hangzhouensis]
MHTKTVATSARLKLDKITEQDADFFLELLNSKGWLTNIGDRNVHSQDQAVAYLREGFLKCYQDNGFGYYVIRLKPCSTPVGICGFLKKPELCYPDLGYALLPQFEGQGYAFEACSAVLDWVQRQYDIQVIDAVTLRENSASIRLLGKLGFDRIGIQVSPDGGELALFRFSSKLLSSPPR